MKTLKHLVLTLCLMGVLLAGCKDDKSKTNSTPSGPAPTLKVVKFANLPYGDHTYSSIGVAKGFFKDAGIDLQAQTIKIEEVVPSLTSGSFDVASVPPGILFSAYDSAPNLCSFVFGDMFQGFALMAQPDRGFKSYAACIKEGMTHEKAVKTVVEQIKNKTFAYPTENAIKPFIDFMLEKGGLTRDDFKNLTLDDPLTVNAMRNKQADFQVGGVPSRLTLQKEGFIPLISSVDLAGGAKASADSKELASILQSGWAMSKDFYNKDHSTALRLASVNYRIMKFMKTDREEAIKIHMAYLTKATGQKFTAADGQIIYDSLDPFLTFEEQKTWFHDSTSPMYYRYINGAILNTFIEQKVYKQKPPTVDDVVFADDTYLELERLKDTSSKAISALEAKSSLSQAARDKLGEAKKYFDAFNYYDADRLAAEATKLVESK